MEILTKPFGKITVDERQRIYFPFGLFGFENLRDFALLDAAQQPFFWLQSIEISEVAFVLIDPRLFRVDYILEIEEVELSEIEIENAQDILDFAIVTIPENASRMTANLQGPIVINRRKKIGRQSISKDKKWKVRHFIMDELKVMEQKPC